MSNQRSGETEGFTLIEVLVALAILSISLGVMLQVFSANLDRMHRNQAASVASALLQSTVDALGKTIPLQTGAKEGEFSPDYRWRLEIAPYGTEEDQKVWPVAVYAVAIKIFWGNADRPKSLSVQTLRLAPKETFK